MTKRSATFLAAAMGVTVLASHAQLALAAPEKPEATGAAAARPHELMVGDAAPAMKGLEFVKGDSVAGFEKDHVYVVEFWATWCGPCIASMPHLSELQKDYAHEVTIIGVTSPDKRNTLDAVREMVSKKGDTMAYTVAWDADGAVRDSYMKAAGQNGIPCSFVVDKAGRIAFIGHPSQLDRVLKDVIAGTWDIQKAARDYVESAKAESDFRSYTELLRRDKNYAAAYAKAREVMAGPTWNNADVLNALAWFIVDPVDGAEKKDLDVAMKAAVRADELTDHANAGILDTLARVHFAKGETDKAIEVQMRAVEVAEADGDERLTEALRGALEEYKQSANR